MTVISLISGNVFFSLSNRLYLVVISERGPREPSTDRFFFPFLQFMICVAVIELPQSRLYRISTGKPIYLATNGMMGPQFADYCLGKWWRNNAPVSADADAQFMECLLRIGSIMILFVNLAPVEFWCPVGSVHLIGWCASKMQQTGRMF